MPEIAKKLAARINFIFFILLSIIVLCTELL